MTNLLDFCSQCARWTRALEQSAVRKGCRIDYGSDLVREE